VYYSFVEVESSKTAFFRVCSEIKSEKLATVTVYWNKDNFKNEAYYGLAGYVYIDQKPARINIIKGKKYSYKDLILTVLHEYGHVLDMRKNKQCQRWKICKEHDYDENELHKITAKPKYIKRALLMTEYMADKIMSGLLSKYNVTCIADNIVWAETFTMINTRKHEMLHGIGASKKVRLQWYNVAKNTLKKAITSEYVKDLERFDAPI